MAERGPVLFQISGTRHCAECARETRPCRIAPVTSQGEECATTARVHLLRYDSLHEIPSSFVARSVKTAMRSPQSRRIWGSDDCPAETIREIAGISAWSRGKLCGNARRASFGQQQRARGHEPKLGHMGVKVTATTLPLPGSIRSIHTRRVSFTSTSHLSACRRARTSSPPATLFVALHVLYRCRCTTVEFHVSRIFGLFVFKGSSLSLRNVYTMRTFVSTWNIHWRNLLRTAAAWHSANAQGGADFLTYEYDYRFRGKCWKI